MLPIDLKSQEHPWVTITVNGDKMKASNESTFRDFNLLPYSEITGFSQILRQRLSDHEFLQLVKRHTGNNKFLADTNQRYFAVLSPETQNQWRDHLHEVIDCLREPTEVWQQRTGDKYDHKYIRFYSNMTMIIEVSFSYSNDPRVVVIKLVSNPDSMRVGVLLL